MRNVRIDVKKNTATVGMNAKIYKLDAIFKVARAFSKICRVDVGAGVDGIVNVTLIPTTRGLSSRKIGYEFLNYVLAEMKISEDS